MGTGVLGCGEDAGTLDDIFGSSLAPGKQKARCKQQWLAVVEAGIAYSVLGFDERVLNSRDLNIWTIHGMTEKNASNTAKSVDADFDNHLCFVSRSSNLKSESLS
ncbi:hypothetical protein EIK77_000552 [Talaromyces pinophilus]|nr:hypothetical protein EIK77_000552 [Talaromyces pinophilus]